MDICFIQDMWGKAMHMHCAADLVSGEIVWLKKRPDIFLRLPDTIWKLPAACYPDKKWISVPDFPASRQ